MKQPWLCLRNKVSRIDDVAKDQNESFCPINQSFPEEYAKNQQQHTGCYVGNKIHIVDSVDSDGLNARGSAQNKE